MIFRQFITAFVVSIIVTGCYYLIAGRKEPPGKFLWSGLIIFAGSWAGGLWLNSCFSSFFGLQSASYVLSGLLIGVIFTLLSLRRPPSGRYETLEKLEQMEKERELQKLTYTILKVLLWFLSAAVSAAVITRIFF